MRLKFLNGDPLLPLSPQSVKFTFLVWLSWNFKPNIFTYLPMIIDITIYEWGHFAPLPPPLQKSNSSFMMRFCWNLKRNIFIYLPITIKINIYKWGTHYLYPPPIPPSKSKILNLWCDFAEIWNRTFSCVYK